VEGGKRQGGGRETEGDRQTGGYGGRETGGGRLRGTRTQTQVGRLGVRMGDLDKILKSQCQSTITK
jgi:hypothetical protein